MSEDTQKPVKKVAKSKRYKGWDPQKESETYDVGFYEKHRKYYDKGIVHYAEWLEQNLQFDSIVDVGCGCGDFLVPLVEKKKVLGIDFSTGAEAMLAIPPECYLCHDLTKPLSELDTKSSYDLVVSLEVYEHIPEEFESTFIDNLLAFKPKTLILSCAEPGQWGRHHYNCRGKDEVVTILTGKGYAYDEALTSSFQKIKKLASFYRKNTAVFTRCDVAA